MATVKDFSVEEKLTSLLTVQKVESKLDEIQVLKGELPMEVSDLEDEIQGLHARKRRVLSHAFSVPEFSTFLAELSGYPIALNLAYRRALARRSVPASGFDGAER